MILIAVPYIFAGNRKKLFEKQDISQLRVTWKNSENLRHCTKIPSRNICSPGNPFSHKWCISKRRHLQKNSIFAVSMTRSSSGQASFDRVKVPFTVMPSDIWWNLSPFRRPIISRNPSGRSISKHSTIFPRNKRQIQIVGVAVPLGICSNLQTCLPPFLRLWSFDFWRLFLPVDFPKRFRCIYKLFLRIWIKYRKYPKFLNL